MNKETLDLLMLVEGSEVIMEDAKLVVVVSDDIPFGQFEVAIEDDSDA
jgi:hypothetical protein